MTDRTTAELQDDVFAEVVQQLVHLPGMDPARRDGHHPGSDAQSCSKNTPCADSLLKS